MHMETSVEQDVEMQESVSRIERTKNEMHKRKTSFNEGNIQRGQQWMQSQYNSDKGIELQRYVYIILYAFIIVLLYYQFYTNLCMVYWYWCINHVRPTRFYITGIIVFCNMTGDIEIFLKVLHPHLYFVDIPTLQLWGLRHVDQE